MIERRLRDLEQHPFRLVTDRELDDRGVTRTEQLALIADGLLIRVNGRVLALGGEEPTWPQRAAAALLAIPGSSLGFETAARALHVGEYETHDGLVLTAPLDVHAFVIGIDLRRTGRLPDEHLTETDGLRHTTLARTLIDLAGVTPEDRLQEVIEAELASKRLTWDEIDTTYGAVAGRGRPGNKRARKVLEAIETRMT